MSEPRPKSGGRRVGRRTFLAAVPAAVAAGASAPGSTGRAQSQAPAARVAKEALKRAEQLLGLEFTDAEEEMMLRGASQNLDSYDTLRKVEVPLDTEPAVTFHPYLPGKRPPRPGPRAKRLKVHAPARVSAVDRVETLAFEPVAVLSELVRRRRVSSLDLTRMYLARLKAHGESLKCVVTLTEPLALAQATEADRELAAGRYRGQLHGIPWGAKDLFATKGIRTTWGAKPYENQVIDLDATVVERLRDAGAVLVAKLSMGSLAQGGVWFGGSTRNPWNTARSSSGSSAGPAAATAAGLVGFSIGTETLGSIMSPSDACGTVGLRPTYGRVSRYGAMALSWTMDKIGPICRSVEDCALAFNAIYGSDGRDDTVVDAAFAWKPDVPLGSLKVGYVREDFDPVESPGAGSSDEAKRRFEAMRVGMGAVLETFRKAGATLVPIRLPDFDAGAIRFILSAEAAAAFDDLTRSRGIDQLTAQGPGDWPNSFRTSRFIPAVEYLRAQRARTLLMRRYAELMRSCDVYLSGTRGPSLVATNLTGHPAVCLKAGFYEKMPWSITVVGRLYDEATLLRVALAYERATPWQAMHPAI
jgi:Asp-tRNA(Asn)/Glu-tRNA(Gln) amidotransferase A subunit family amidase